MFNGKMRVLKVPGTRLSRPESFLRLPGFLRVARPLIAIKSLPEHE
jgi:hypothetical protein